MARMQESDGRTGRGGGAPGLVEVVAEEGQVEAAAEHLPQPRRRRVADSESRGVGAREASDAQ